MNASSTAFLLVLGFGMFFCFLLALCALLGTAVAYWSREKRNKLVTEKEPTIRALETRIKALEMEWEDVYEKLQRIAGRADKRNALSKAQGPAESEAPIMRRSDLLRSA